MSRILLIVRWGVVGILASSFLFMAVYKLMGKMTLDFVAWGYPAWFVYMVGVLEILGALGLLWRKTLGLSTFLLAVLAAGASLTHISHHDGLIPPLPAIALLLMSFGLMYLNAKYRETFASEE